MPNYLSVDARSLINEMLAVDPVKRITTPEITQHPFYTTALRTFNDASRPFHHNPSIISKYDAFVGVTSDESVPRTGTDGPGLRKTSSTSLRQEWKESTRRTFGSVYGGPRCSREHRQGGMYATARQALGRTRP